MDIYDLETKRWYRVAKARFVGIYLSRLRYSNLARFPVDGDLVWDQTYGLRAVGLGNMPPVPQPKMAMTPTLDQMANLVALTRADGKTPLRFRVGSRVYRKLGHDVSPKYLPTTLAVMGVEVVVDDNVGPNDIQLDNAEKQE